VINWLVLKRPMTLKSVRINNDVQYAVVFGRMISEN